MCSSVSSVVIPESVVYIGKHAFYNLNNTTFYTSADKIMPYWDARFNSSYRPVFWDCTLSNDNSYVVSVTVSNKLLINKDAKGGISDPTREGYVFSGWSTSENGAIEYTSQNIATAPDGTVLYARWDTVGE